MYYFNNSKKTNVGSNHERTHSPTWSDIFDDQESDGHRSQDFSDSGMVVDNGRRYWAQQSTHGVLATLTPSQSFTPTQVLSSTQVVPSSQEQNDVIVISSESHSQEEKKAEKRKLKKIAKRSDTNGQKENVAINPPSPSKSSPESKRRAIPLSPQNSAADVDESDKKGLYAFRYLIKPEHHNPSNYFAVLNQNLHVIANTVGQAGRPILSFASRNPKLEEKTHFTGSRKIHGLLSVDGEYHAVKKVALDTLSRWGFHEELRKVQDIQNNLRRNIKSEVRPKFVLAVIVDDAQQDKVNQQELGRVLHLATADMPTINFRIRFIDKNGKHSDITTVIDCFNAYSDRAAQPQPKRVSLMSRFLSQGNPPKSHANQADPQWYPDTIRGITNDFGIINQDYQTTIITKLIMLKSYLDTPEAKQCSQKVINAVNNHFDELINAYKATRVEIEQFKMGKLRSVMQTSTDEQKRLYDQLSTIVGLLEQNVSSQIKTYKSLQEKINIGTFSQLSTVISQYADRSITRLQQAGPVSSALEQNDGAPRAIVTY